MWGLDFEDGEKVTAPEGGTQKRVLQMPPAPLGEGLQS